MLLRITAALAAALFLACAAPPKAPEEAPEAPPESPAPAKPGASGPSPEEQLIISAISAGDCLSLYAYLEQGKEKTEPRVYLRAASALKRYTSPDTAAAKYRSNKMDARVRRVPQSISDRLDTGPENAVSALVFNLTAGMGDPYNKAKVIHDWICDNIAFDTEMYYSGRGRNQDYISVLKKKAALSSGYANLFYGMCKIAGLEALVIRGYSKGFGYRGAIGKNPDHDWNAVKLSGKWYLVDAAWDAGYVEGSAFIKRYTTAWLYAGSRDFLYSHLPEKEQNQFYAPPLDAEIFQKEPYIPGAFFQYGLELKTPEKLAYETIAGEVLSIDINAGSMNTLLDAALRGTDFREIEGAAWQERNNAAYRFFFDVPGQGEYRAVVLARNKNEKRIQERIGIAGFERTILPGLARLVEENKITPAEADYYRASYVKVPENNLYYYQEDQFNLPANNAILKIQELLHISSSPPDTALDLNIRAAPAYAGYQSPAAHGGEKVRRFPRALPALREAIATRIISPLDGTLETGAEIKFSLSSRDYSRFSLSCGEESIPFTRTNPTSPFELTWIIPQGAKELSITASKDGKIYAGLVRYDAGKNDEP